MILKQKNRLSFFQFPNLAEYSGIQHGIFTRNGGHSIAPFHHLNVSFGTGDSEEAVRQNRALISQCMDETPLVFVSQVHGTDVARIRDKTLPSQPADAMITDLPGRCLVIQVADCQAVLLYDPVRQVVANVHSGWRGSIRNIIGKTLRVMNAEFNCNPRDVIAGIGPSLGPCCAEFIHYQSEIPEMFWKYKDAADHFDFWAISRDQLVSEGVSGSNIHTSGLCTKCRTDLFFSYRGEKTTGRFAAVIGLR